MARSRAIRFCVAFQIHRIAHLIRFAGLIKPVAAQPRNFTGIPALVPKIQRKPRGIGFIERQRVGQLLVPIGVKGLARRILFNVVRVASVMKAAFRPGCALQVSHGMAVFVRHHVPVKRLERTQVHFRHFFPSIAASPVKSLSWRGTVGDDFLENGRFGNACDGLDMLRQFIQGLENGPGVGFGFADVKFCFVMLEDGAGKKVACHVSHVFLPCQYQLAVHSSGMAGPAA